jgi:predicted nucleotidyltransferase
MRTSQRVAVVSDRAELLTVLRREMPSLQKTYGVKRLALYGSFARGEAGPRSDVDLLVETARPLGLEFVTLAQYLEKALGRKVDLATFESLRRSKTLPRRRAAADAIENSLVDVC